MFIGHWAPALAVAAQRKAPGLTTLFIAAQLIDWVFYTMVLATFEHMRFTPGISVMNSLDLYHMPYSHSLLGAAVLSALFAWLLWGIHRNTRYALLVAGVALSHWFLDLLVHIPDLTLWGTPPKLGLGLWNHPWIEIPLELGITLAALLYYWRKRGPGLTKIAMLGLTLLVLQLINWAAPAEHEVTTGVSVLAFTAYTIATLTAWWVAKSEGEARRTR